MEDPRGWTERILAYSGIAATPGDLPFVAPDEAVFEPNHTVDGNPVRFSTGVTRLRADEEWRTKLSPADRALVTLATLPGLLRYGYHPLPIGRRA
jgi:hypothetical protein